MNQSIGWVATAAFAASYLCKSQKNMRRVQALAATLWIIYGVVVGAVPVVVANLVVAVMAVIYPWLKQVFANRKEAAAEVPAVAATLHSA